MYKLRENLNPKDLEKVLNEMPSEARQSVWSIDPNYVFIIDGVEYKKNKKT
jgi:hypothetical protein